MDYPFAEVTYPQDMRNCLTCHNDSASGSAWKTAVTISNCTSCHDTSTFSGPNPTHGGGAASEDQCSNCHVQSNLPQLSVAGAHAISTQLPFAAVDAVGARILRPASGSKSCRLNAASFVPGGFPTLPSGSSIRPAAMRRTTYTTARTSPGAAVCAQRHRAARVRHRLEHGGHQQRRQRLRSRAADFAEPAGGLPVGAGDIPRV